MIVDYVTSLTTKDYSCNILLVLRKLTDNWRNKITVFYASSSWRL